MTKIVLAIAVSCGAVSLTLVALSFWWNPTVSYHPRAAEQHTDRGELLHLSGYPVLRLRGSPYERGYQHGVLLREAVRANVQHFLAYVYQEFSLGKYGAQLLLDYTYSCFRPYIPAAYQQEMQGLADGSGLPLRDIQRVHAAPDLFELRGVLSCASFAAFGQATGDGRLYHLRNLDWLFDAGVQRYPLLLVYPEEGMVNIGYAGFIGVVSGMNRAGISLGQIGAASRDWSLRGVPMPFLLRRVLEEATGLESAAELIRTAPRTVGHTYVIASGTESRAIAIESTHNLCVIFHDDRTGTVDYARPVTDVIYRADPALSQEVRRWQTCSNGYPHPPAGSLAYEVRYRKQGELLQRYHGQITADLARDIARAIAPPSNIQSVIYSPATLEFWVANADLTTRAAHRPYHHFSLSQLLDIPRAEPFQEASS